MLKIKSLDGSRVLGEVKHPDDSGKTTRWRRWALNILDFVSLGGIVHHCGEICKKVEKGNNWHSPRYGLMLMATPTVRGISVLTMSG